MSGILIAGIGNIFQGDDAFGVEVIPRLRERGLPAGVKAVDFGIRGIDFAYALLDGHDAVVLIDAAPRGEPPGTVSVIEVAPADAAAQADAPSLSPHALDPAAALAWVRAMGRAAPPVFLVACEPENLGGEEGAMGLSPPVAAAIEPAVSAVSVLVRRLQNQMWKGACDDVEDRARPARRCDHRGEREGRGALHQDQHDVTR